MDTKLHDTFENILRLGKASSDPQQLSAVQTSHENVQKALGSRPMLGEPKAMASSEATTTVFDTKAASKTALLTADPENRIAQIIKDFAIAERRRNFRFLARYSHEYMNGEDLDVYRASQERSKASIKARKLDPSWFTASARYVFYQPISGLEDVVPIRFGAQDGNSDEISIDDMEAMDIEDKKSWISLCSWMRKRFDWDDECDWTQPGGAQLQLQNQVTWWNSNGKHFRLLHLPPEIRKLVYVEILGGGIILPQVHGNRVTVGRGLTVGPKNRAGLRLDPDIEHPNVKILQTSRQIYDEATDAVWQDATQRFNWKSGFTRRNILQIYRFGHPKGLTRIQLELPASLYFQMIGIQPQRWVPFDSTFQGSPTATIGLLKKLQTIKSIDFRFISPNHPNAVDPWNAISRQPTSVAHSCQKIWIHWFFTLAFEQLRDWTYDTGGEKPMKTKITMSGCIKTSTREEWEAIFANERFSSGQHLNNPDNIDSEKKQILATNKVNLPIRCYCSVPCSDLDMLNNGYQQFVHSDLRHRVDGLEEAIQKSYFSFED